MSLNLKDTISNNINSLLQNNMSSSGDLTQQELIDKTLIDAGLPQNKINSLIDLAKDRLTCDTDCQKKRQGALYKKEWELAKKNYKNAPEEIRRTEKNYYVYDKGYTAYKDMLFDRYAKTAAEFKQSSNQKYNAVSGEIQDMLANYDAGTAYLKRMNELYDIKLAEKTKLKRDIDDYIGNTQTSGRKVVYEDRARDWLTSFRTIMLYIYFLILIYYIVLGSFIPKQAYKQWKVWLLILAYILLPFYLLNWLVKLIFALYDYLKSWRLPKNVYA